LPPAAALQRDVSLFAVQSEIPAAVPFSVNLAQYKWVTPDSTTEYWATKPFDPETKLSELGDVGGLQPDVSNLETTERVDESTSAGPPDV
jgi:hypothetical protein